MTKTLIDIDDELLEQAMRVTGATTKKAAVNEALAQTVRRSAALEYVDMLRTGVVVELDDPDVIADAQR
jgi:Arc/MetJ family transcription regulator